MKRLLMGMTTVLLSPTKPVVREIERAPRMASGGASYCVTDVAHE